MNKTAIKNFAVNARNKLIEDITQKVYELGILEKEIKDIETFVGGFKIKGINNGKTYKTYQIKQREKLIKNIKEKGYNQVVEEVAYTWFNRFIALRFMEVNDYLPTGVRVLSSVDENKKEPDIIKEALNINLDIDKDIVYRLIDENDTEDLYKYLLIKQCNELGKIMPMVFEEISDYTELLLPDNLLSENSVIMNLVNSIDEEDYLDQVEIIGWMYQYYISEKKDEVFADLKKNKKITKENIPAATQLFTPKWIVKYMVENSLGRLWLESHPDEDLQKQWKYYLEEAEQEPEVQKQLDELKNPDLKPVDIKVLDPACGSGHILVYAFDVLYDIYLKANYSERDIPQLILEKNLYGLDIDDRAGQLTSFALMMKARSKNKRIFRNKIDLNVCSIQESNGITKEVIDYFVGDNEELREDVEYLVDVFKDAKEYGSILDVKKIDFESLGKRFEEILNEDTLNYNLTYKEIVLEKIPALILQGKIMSDKYEVVCTNPPYMGSKGMCFKLSTYLDLHYINSKKDLYTVFVDKGFRFLREKGFLSMITMHSWLFLDAFKSLRSRIIENYSIFSILHLGMEAFENIIGKVVQTVAFVIRNESIFGIKPTSIRLVDFYDSRRNEKEMQFFNKTYRYSDVKQCDFNNIPNTPIAYWISKRVMEIYQLINENGKFIEFKTGLVAGNNQKYFRNWTEIIYNEIGFNFHNINETNDSIYKWVPLNHGGDRRKWYGNHNEVVFFKNNASKIRKESNSMLRNESFYFKHGFNWNRVGSNVNFAARISLSGFVFDDVSPSGFLTDMNYFNYCIGFYNTKVFNYLLNIINTGLKTEIGHMSKIPIFITGSMEVKDQICKLTCLCIDISKIEWDNNETSWDFQYHPLLTYSALKNDFAYNNIETAFRRWEDFTDEQFEQLKHNEEELNRIFIEIYGLQDELTPEVEDKDVTIRKADRERDIKSFLSYAVGCMFGRYSLDEDGLIYAGGEFNINRYNKFIPTTDNVLVIADDDYFEDDIVNRFVEFVKITFSEKSLQENLDYIAETLGQKTGETSRQTIRRYFLKDFYNDHVKIYQKRPIYWQFDSGKQNGFKALIYMHRYDASTVSRVRIDYFHKLQKKYEAEVKRLELMLESDLSTRDAAVVRKKIDSIKKQITECLSYDQVIAHVANQKIEIDLDDGVVVNYAKFQDIEVPQGEGKKPITANLLSRI